VDGAGRTIRASQVEAASALVTAKSNLVFQRTLVDYFTGELKVPGNTSDANG
jgi:hypothetical protein